MCVSFVASFCSSVEIGLVTDLNATLDSLHLENLQVAAIVRRTLQQLDDLTRRASGTTSGV